MFWKAKHSESVISISSPSVVKGISLLEEKNIFLNTGLTAASINLCARTENLSNMMNVKEFSVAKATLHSQMSVRPSVC